MNECYPRAGREGTRVNVIISRHEDFCRHGRGQGIRRRLFLLYAMPDKFAYDGFLNHSAKDTGVMRELAEGLKKDGVRVWFEEWEKQGRNTVKRSEGMEQSRVMVLGLSGNSYGEEWERLEAET